MAIITPKDVWLYLVGFTTTSETLTVTTSTAVAQGYSNLGLYPIKDTEAIYNNGVLMTKTANYQINYDTGYITYTTKPTGTVSCTYWTAELPNSQVEELISQVDAEIRSYGIAFEATTVSSEMMDYDASGLLKVRKKPINSISSLELNYNPSETTASWQALTAGYGKDYILDMLNGKIKFLKDKGYDDIQNVRASYIYGFTLALWPNQYALGKRLETIMCGSKLLAMKTLGNDFSSQDSIRIAEIAITKANANVRETLNMNVDEIKDSLKRLGVYDESDRI